MEIEESKFIPTNPFCVEPRLAETEGHPAEKVPHSQPYPNSSDYSILVTIVISCFIHGVSSTWWEFEQYFVKHEPRTRFVVVPMVFRLTFAKS